MEPLACGAARVLPHLYHFGGNSYLLVSDRGEGLVVDPTLGSIGQLKPLMREIGLKNIGVATATHFHLDHSDALNLVRAQYNAAVWLNPWAAAPLKDRDLYDVPWLPFESIAADRLLPQEGAFRWREYRFAIRPFPGQTWWHCAFDAAIDGRHALFSGDNFQPPARWNGTGGFCAFNGSRFADRFTRSAQTALDIAPQIICNGHGNIYRFAAGHYRRILRWSAKAEKAVQDLCPSAAWLADYDCRALRWQPFVSRARSTPFAPTAQRRRRTACNACRRCPSRAHPTPPPPPPKSPTTASSPHPPPSPIAPTPFSTGAKQSNLKRRRSPWPTSTRCPSPQCTNWRNSTKPTPASICPTPTSATPLRKTRPGPKR